MLLGFDHVILVVESCEAAARSYEQMGFSVTRREDAAKGPSENRLVVFPDGSYVELLQLVDPDYTAKHRFNGLRQIGEGWADFSIRTDAIDAAKARLDAAGLLAAGPSNYSKALASGDTWTVRIVNAGRGTGHPALPFFVEDATVRSLRVPDGRTAHTNGATGVGRVTLVVGDLDEVVRQMSIALDTQPAVLAAPAGARRAARYDLAGRQVDIVEVDDNTPSELKAVHDARGDCLYEVAINGATADAFDPRHCHGGRLRVAANA